MKQDVSGIMGDEVANIDVYRYRLPEIFRPVSSERFSGEDQPKIVLTSCRIDRRKGLELGVSAASIVLREIADVNFITRGPISDRGYFNELRAMMTRERLAPHVALIGEECKYEDLPNIM